MTPTRRAAVLVGCVVVALLAAAYAGSRESAPGPSTGPGTVRLGPDAGETVAGYLVRLPGELPPDGTVVLALVQFDITRETTAALAATAGTAPALAVLRVSIPRVQTALRFEELEEAVPLPRAVGSARLRAAATAEGDAARLAGRPGDVASAEAAALADPACRCVLALVVRADRAALAALATRPAVRAVHAAPPQVTLRELALSPLLPEQTERADPGPDDGNVPAG